jgi:hypothetical protein
MTPWLVEIEERIDVEQRVVIVPWLDMDEPSLGPLLPLLTI